jgi:hypothetical protein
MGARRTHIVDEDLCCGVCALGGHDVGGGDPPAPRRVELIRRQ